MSWLKDIRGRIDDVVENAERARKRATAVVVEKKDDLLLRLTKVDEQMTSEIATLKARLSRVKAENDKLLAKVSNLTSEKARMEARINSLETGRDQDRVEIKDLRRACIVGWSVAGVTILGMIVMSFIFAAQF